MSTELRQSTEAVTSLLQDPGEDDDDAVVREAWTAIGTAQDAIALLRETAARSRALRVQAQSLQDDAFRLRRRVEPRRSGLGRGPRRTTENDA